MTGVEGIPLAKLKRALRQAEHTQALLEKEGVSLKDLDDWINAATMRLEGESDV